MFFKKLMFNIVLSIFVVLCLRACTMSIYVQNVITLRSMIKSVIWGLMKNIVLLNMLDILRRKANSLQTRANQA